MRQIRQALKESDKLFAYGYQECKNGHTLRTAAGCPQCRTQYLAKAKESISPGYVYIARSRTSRLVKVGLSTQPHARLYMARLQGYGGIYDWEIRHWVYVDRMGKAESAVKRLLAEFRIRRPWERQGEQEVASEIYRCSLTLAAEALLQGTLAYQR